MRGKRGGVVKRLVKRRTEPRCVRGTNAPLKMLPIRCEEPRQAVDV